MKACVRDSSMHSIFNFLFFIFYLDQKMENGKDIEFSIFAIDWKMKNERLRPIVHFSFIPGLQISIWYRYRQKRFRPITSVAYWLIESITPNRASLQSHSSLGIEKIWEVSVSDSPRTEN